MNEKESALHSEATEKQGSNTRYSFNLHVSSSNVKSKLQQDQEYFINTFTRFTLQNFIQNKLVERSVIPYNGNFSKCHRASIGSIISLVRNAETSRAYYNNVVTCANAMCCPVCSARIMGKRSAEIKKAVHQWLNENVLNTCYMITLTFAHRLEDRLVDLLIAFKRALEAFWCNGSLKRLLSACGRVGRITATEIQYSQTNGYHPHQHILLFCRKTDFDLEALRGYWLRALETVGLSGLSDIALDLIEARSAENYLTKISSEMALGNLKQGRGSGHYSPMQLLAEAADGSDWATDRYIEFFRAVKGMHSLCWSRGLKAYFGIDDVSDQEITDGASQPELTKFLDMISDAFKFLSASEKALLRNYAAFDDFEHAAALLDRVGAEYWK